MSIKLLNGFDTLIGKPVPGGTASRILKIDLNGDLGYSFFEVEDEDYFSGAVPGRHMENMEWAGPRLEWLDLSGFSQPNAMGVSMGDGNTGSFFVIDRDNISAKLQVLVDPGNPAGCSLTFSAAGLGSGPHELSVAQDWISVDATLDMNLNLLTGLDDPVDRTDAVHLGLLDVRVPVGTILSRAVLLLRASSVDVATFTPGDDWPNLGTGGSTLDAICTGTVDGADPGTPVLATDPEPGFELADGSSGSSSATPFYYVPHSSLLDIGSGSCTSLVRINWSGTSGGFDNIASKIDTSGGAMGAGGTGRQVVDYVTTGGTTVIVSDGTTTVMADSGSVLSAGEHLIVYRLDRANDELVIFVDGVKGTPESLGALGSVTAAHPLIFGRGHEQVGRDYAYWDEALTDDEIVALSTELGVTNHVPTAPYDPADDGKVWTAVGEGRAIWRPVVGLVPAPADPADDDKVLTASGGTYDWAAGAGGAPGGSDTHVQYNDGGAFGGEAAFAYNEGTNILTVDGGVRVSGTAAFSNTGGDGSIYFDSNAAKIYGYTSIDLHDGTGRFAQFTRNRMEFNPANAFVVSLLGGGQGDWSILLGPAAVGTYQGIGVGCYVSGGVTATANNDVLAGTMFRPRFTPGAYTGLTQIGTVFATPNANSISVRVYGASSQAVDLFQIVDNSANVLMAVAKNGAIKPASLADSAAENGTIYYSTDAAKLVYKDGSGTVNNLY